MFMPSFWPGEVHGLYSLWGHKSQTWLSDFCFHFHFPAFFWGFPDGASGKEPACQCRRHKRCGLSPWVGKIPWRRAWQPTPVLFLPGEYHGQRSLVGYSPWIRKESDFHFLPHLNWERNFQTEKAASLQVYPKMRKAQSDRFCVHSFSLNASARMVPVLQADQLSIIWSGSLYNTFLSPHGISPTQLKY